MRLQKYSNNMVLPKCATMDNVFVKDGETKMCRNKLRRKGRYDSHYRENCLIRMLKKQLTKILHT